MPARWPRLALPVLALALVGVGGWAMVGRAEEDFGTAEPGRRVYDRSGVLTPHEITELERHAATVARTGVPVVVYIRVREADQGEAEAAAAALMASWRVESNPGAGDGLVVFLNLDPDDLESEDVALVAGGALTARGSLPGHERRRIVRAEMLDRFKSERTVAGLAAGLDAAARSLRLGPQAAPTPGVVERTAAGIAKVPLNLLAALAALGALAFATGAWRSAALAGTGAPLPATGLPPVRPLGPALAGALAWGRVRRAALAAMLLDLADRGAVALEPLAAGPRRRAGMGVRLRDDGQLRDGPERTLWHALSAAADPSGAVPPGALPRVLADGGPVSLAVRGALEEQGLWDRAATAKRRPFGTVAGALLVGAVVALAVSVLGREPWGLLAVSVLLLGGVAVLLFARTYPVTTPAGAVAAAPWRALRRDLSAGGAGGRPIDGGALPTPYAVALGRSSALDRILVPEDATDQTPKRRGQAAGDAPGDRGDRWCGVVRAVRGMMRS